MIILSDSGGLPESLNRMIHQASTVENVESLLILSCDANGFTPENIDCILEGAPLPLFGGIFPAIIDGHRLLREGSMVIGLPNVVETMFIPELSNSMVDYEEFLDRQIFDSTVLQTMMVFVDGFSRRINAFIESLFNVFGLQINYIGGGAGSLSMTSKPCLFTNRGLMKDGAVLALLGLASGVGVSHGWKSLEGPFRVTKSEYNKILTLDWAPAFEVYRKVVEKHSGREFKEDNFFSIARAYPFGISRMDSEQIVRDPLQVGPDHSLICVGEVPEGSFISILHGNESSLVDAASQALALAHKAFPKSCRQGLHFFIDCISRVLFLDELFERELEAVYEATCPLVGACTIGEIANCGTEYLEFYNKTAVFAVLENS